MKKIPKHFETTPIVYAVGKNYQIIVPVSCETLMWVKVGEACFYDDVNGILRSNCTTHRMTVPMELLDAAREYKVCYRVVNERKPYYSDVSDIFEYSSIFYPVKQEGARFFHIADAHNTVEMPVAAAKAFGNIDFLILNGDLPDHSGDIKNFNTIHRIAAEITNGEKPVVFSRGNHDMRGIHAESIAEHTPTDNGRSYYTFCLGSIWGMVLDCGEDKSDAHSEYAHTVCCEDFRRRQTEFIKNVISKSNEEYEKIGVKNRLIICHIPFTESFEQPFDIEKNTYFEWCRLLREHIKPDVMICGHVHQAYVTHEGDARDAWGQSCPVVVASATVAVSQKMPDTIQENGVYISAGFEFNEKQRTVVFQGSNGIVYDTVDLS